MKESKSGLSVQYLHLCSSIYLPFPSTTFQNYRRLLYDRLFQFFSLVVLAKHYHLTIDKNDRENRLRIEKFLADYIDFKPSRYTYADVKNITNKFIDKLGQGAYGTIYRGKLSNMTSSLQRRF